ncbi:hypothetical protein CC117_16020 [Parafrankia colletiae]|uniref:Uncharacterized protein n=1 Tax=Parafrankia colletiae TaxID=573497 RepID=A0A1S1QW94_9ACTN|nr:hypothetical protein CC117_16020 [Parafrankia colletiae]
MPLLYFRGEGLFLRLAGAGQRADGHRQQFGQGSVRVEAQVNPVAPDHRDLGGIDEDGALTLGQLA